jgi:5'-3' exonuclease
MYSNYKGNRIRQVPDKSIEKARGILKTQIFALRDDYLPDAGFKNVFWSDGFEADDVIASICQSNPGESFVIISEDKDMYQLLSSKVSIYHPRQEQIVTPQVFTEKYGINPEQWAAVKGLCGCDSDNVDGVRGVGEKTAIRYLRGELKTSLKSYKAILESQKIIDRNLKLVVLPFVGCPKFEIQRDEITREKWQKLLDKLAIKRIGRLDQPSFWR